MDRKELIAKLDTLAARIAEREAMETTLQQIHGSMTEADGEITALYRELKDHFEPIVATIPSAELESDFNLGLGPRERILSLLENTRQKLDASHITKACGLEPRKAGPHFAALSRAGLIRKTEDHKWVAA